MTTYAIIGVGALLLAALVGVLIWLVVRNARDKAATEVALKKAEDSLAVERERINNDSENDTLSDDELADRLNRWRL